jgi:hypothetical protein
VFNVKYLAQSSCDKKNGIEFSRWTMALSGTI